MKNQLRLLSLVAISTTGAAYAQNPFSDVFQIMTRQRGVDSMGCRGCHIGEAPVPGFPYFGATEQAVENYLTTDDFGAHVAGRRTSPIARRLRHDGSPAPMPRGGLQWTSVELDVLYAWLDAISYPRVEEFSDTFSGDVIDLSKWTVTFGSGGGIAYQSNGLYLSAYPNDGTSGAQVASNNPYSLFESAAYVRMDQVVNNGSITNQFVVMKDLDNSLNWWFENGNLMAIDVVAGVETIRAVLPYQPSDYAWLRFRESDGNVYWETSSDGTNWVAQATSPNAFPLGSLTVVFLVQEFGEGIADPGTARYSNFNVGLGPTGVSD